MRARTQWVPAETGGSGVNGPSAESAYTNVAVAAPKPAMAVGTARLVPS